MVIIDERTIVFVIVFAIAAAAGVFVRSLRFDKRKPANLSTVSGLLTSRRPRGRLWRRLSVRCWRVVERQRILGTNSFPDVLLQEESGVSKFLKKYSVVASQRI